MTRLARCTAIAALTIALASCGSEEKTAGPGLGGSGGGGGAGAGGSSTGGTSSGGGAGQAGSGGSIPDGKIHIGFWCGLPAAELTSERIEEIRAAGFTLVSNACDGTTYEAAYDKKLISLANGAGLRATITDTHASQALAGQSFDQNLDALVADYAKLPGLFAYHLVDEPAASAFPSIGSVVDGLRTRDPAHVALVNLLPDYATAAQLGTATYSEHVTSFVDQVKPAFFTYDHYNFLSDGSDGASFFANLAVVRSVSVAKKTPFGQYIQAISYNGHRATNGPEKRWAALHTLAYGGTGVFYFTYWTPIQTSENFGDGIIGANGQRTTQYDDVSAINRELTAIGKYLGNATSTAVFHNGPLAAGTTPRAPGMPVYLPSPAKITVGLFALDADVYALLVNRDHAATTESDVIVASSDGKPEVLDVPSAKLVSAPSPQTDPAGTRFHVSLPAGDGILIHLRGPVPTGAPGAEAYYGTVRADAGWLDVVDSAFGTDRLRTAGWNDCPEGTVEIGKDFQSNGFWLCARSDLATRSFYVGNVVADTGYMYHVQNGTATQTGMAGWDQCPAGKLLGHRFESNGFWICLE